MSLPIVIEDPKTGTPTRVTKFGQLVVAPLDYSAPAFDTIDIADTAFNFIGPEPNKSIVITDILLNADRSVSVNGATVDVYEASSATSVTIDQAILTTDLPKQISRDLVGLNLIVPEGKWVNVKSDDLNILVTIMFYRVPVKE